MKSNVTEYSNLNKLVHLCLAVFGILAFLTSELADSGHQSYGFLIHAYLGLTMGASLISRLILGVTSKGSMTFSGWSPFSKQQWKSALIDIKDLALLRLPKCSNHEGLAGIVQAYGLIVFSWMALTGTCLFFLASEVESELFELFEELHEVGESLIPLYLFLHVGAVVFHSVMGHPIWQKMFKFGLK